MRPLQSRTGLLAAAALGLVLAGCGGGDTAATGSTAVPATSAGSTSAPASKAAASPGASAPAGRAGAGSTFTSLSGKATVPTEVDGKKIRLTVGPLAVRVGSIKDLSGFKLSRAAKQSVPVYVKAKFTHAGGPTLKSPYFAASIFFEDDAGDQPQSVTLLGDFPKCESPQPPRFAKGDSVIQCRVYLMVKEGKPGKVYGTWAGFGDEDKVTWKIG